MLGSIFIGLSGMNAYARGLRTISHNVANLNTPGFKATSVRFTDQFNQGGLGSAYRAGTGQLGMGVRLGQAALDFGQGDLRQTGQNLDLAVQGQGFLVLLDGGDVRYARTGQFTIDESGGIALIGGGGRLAVLNASNQPVPLTVDVNRALEPEPTTRVRFANNLSSSATEFTVSNIQVYDSLGTRHTWSARFSPVGAASPGEWTVTVLDSAGEDLHAGQIRFIGGIIDPASAEMAVTLTPPGADELSVTFDFSGHVTSFSSGTTSTLSAVTDDGSGLGTLTGVSVNAEGRVILTYSNGRTEDRGAVALAAFRDPQALEQLGDGRFRADTTSIAYVASGDARAGRLVSGQIEASNVDLSQQFGELILIQRGFQASSQVVSVSNDMIQQLFGIRGQG